MDNAYRVITPSHRPDDDEGHTNPFYPLDGTLLAVVALGDISATTVVRYQVGRAQEHPGYQRLASLLTHDDSYDPSCAVIASYLLPGTTIR